MKLFFLILIATTITYSQNVNILSIDYIANEGFLIAGETKRILVDGIFTQGWGKYHTPTQETLINERNALPPFDSLSFILFSHKHDDHINPGYTVEHMMNDKSAFLLCPPQVNDLLINMEEYSKISDRITVINTEPKNILDLTVNNQSFKVIPIPHPDDSNNEIQNIGFVFCIENFTVFHPGDGYSNSLTDYENVNTAGDSIDIAFIPRWFFNNEYGDGGKEIIQYLKPRIIIPMHINTDRYSYYKELVKNIDGMPHVIFMERCMEKIILKKYDNLISIITDVDKYESNNFPNFIHIEQNYPNPFNPSTTISYNISKSGNVQLKVYDTRGREIKTLVDSFQNAGEYSIIWNGKNNLNIPVGSGIYFYSLLLNTMNVQKKMILLR